MVRVRATALEPGALVEIYQGSDTGSSQVDGGTCDGTDLAIAEPVLLGQVVVDANGLARASFEVGADGCGQYLEAVESTVCGSSGAKVIGVACGGNRYEDQLDGTILDCSTDLLWLKDASCQDLPLTDAEGRANWDDAVAGAASLSDGTCGLTDGSAAGDWRLAHPSEMCSAYNSGDLLPCPSANAADSLIDSSVGPPTVVNATGDDVWTEGDAFIGVQAERYWSSQESFGPLSWLGHLGTGDVTIASRSNAFFVWPVRRSR